MSAPAAHARACRPHPAARWLAVWLACAAVPAWAQSGPGLRVAASIDSSLSAVVNSRLGGRDAAEVVAEVRPGLSISSRSGRVVGSLTYGLQLQQRSRNSESDDGVQHNLQAQFSAEAVERWLYVDGSAGISQQLKDPYGVRGTGDSAAGSSNRLEVATASLSPYVRGILGGSVTYELRLNAAGTNARRSIDNDSTTWGGAFNIGAQVGRYGWGLVATTQESDYRRAGNTRNDRVYGTLSWLPDPDYTLSVRGGEEASDVGTPLEQRFTTYGGSFGWRPSPRTRAQLDYEKRYFGDSYRVLVEQRMSNASFSISSSRSDSTSSSVSRGAITALQLQEAILAATITDPGLRRQQALADLQLAGIDPTQIIIISSLNSAVSIAENHAITFGYSGRNLSFGAQAYLGKNRVIDRNTPGNQEPVEQFGWQANLGYRLGPTTSFTLTGGRQDTRATSQRAGTNLKTVAASLGAQLGRNGSASLGARYSVFNSSTDPYREAAITASAGYRF